MSENGRTFLGSSVLNEGKIVSYRSLGREVKVHSNVAKKMLYEFYSTQTTKSPDSINATYLLTGVPKASREACVNGNQKDGEDTHMQSSPYLSSSRPQQEQQDEAVPSRTIVLAKEEDLEAAKANFRQIHSIHIYSLGPSRNLQILSDCNRTISTKYAIGDPLVLQENYGVIRNTCVQRRTGRRSHIGLPTMSTEVINNNTRSKAQGTKSDPKNVVTSFAKPLSGEESTQSTSKAVVVQNVKTKVPGHVKEKPPSKPSAPKRQPSDIFKSFSGPQKGSKNEATSNPTDATPTHVVGPEQVSSVPEDDPIKFASEDEQEENFVGSYGAKTKTLKSQSERAEQLHRMMEDEDQEMEDSGDDPSQASQEPEPVNRLTAQKGTTPEPPVVVSGGRRRGKRKVMKKQTLKDEEGYLVTLEEPAWESFSEDESIPQRHKTFATSVPTLMGKGKKSGGRPGQGNIMSFFGKNQRTKSED